MNHLFRSHSFTAGKSMADEMARTPEAGAHGPVKAAHSSESSPCGALKAAPSSESSPCGALRAVPSSDTGAQPALGAACGGVSMPTGTIPGLSLPVSRIFFGTAMSPFLTGGNGDDLLDAMVSLGINAFDTARGYGMAEESLGRWIARRRCRDRVIVLSKCGNVNMLGKVNVNRTVIETELSRSLKALGTDYIDIYLLHRDDPRTPVGEFIDTLNKAKKAGMIRIFGVSNWTDARIREANAYAAARGLEGFTVSSPNYGLAITREDPWGGDCISISGPENAAAREWYAETQMPVLAYSSLGRGFFSGKFKSFDYRGAERVLDSAGRCGYLCGENMERLARAETLAARYGQTVPQIAMRYLFSSDMNMFAVVSTSKAARMLDNIRAASCPLSKEDISYLTPSATAHSSHLP